MAKKDGYINSEQEERLFWTLYDEHLNEDDPLQALLKWQHALRPGNAWYATWHDAIQPPVRPDPDTRQRSPPHCANLASAKRQLRLKHHREKNRAQYQSLTQTTKMRAKKNTIATVETQTTLAI